MFGSRGGGWLGGLLEGIIGVLLLRGRGRGAGGSRGVECMDGGDGFERWKCYWGVWLSLRVLLCKFAGR